MASEAQTNANRVNSQKSTGPRTPEGKAVVSQNAVKHGLFADETVINGEDQARFDLHHDAMVGEMWPVGVMESMLAERIVSLSWRLQRTERMQNQAIDEMIKELKPSPLQLYAQSTIPKFLRESEEDMKAPEPRLALGRVAKKDWANNRVLERLMMYERRIESSMFRTMNKLKQLQVMRRMEKPAEEEMPAETLATTNPKACLKKQTQFASAMEDAKAYARKDYDDKPRCGVTENKANSKPNNANLMPARPFRDSDGSEKRRMVESRGDLCCQPREKSCSCDTKTERSRGLHNLGAKQATTCRFP